MMTSFGQIREEAKAKGKKRIVIAPVTAATDFGRPLRRHGGRPGLSRPHR